MTKEDKDHFKKSTCLKLFEISATLKIGIGELSLILKISESKLKAWEKRGTVPFGDFKYHQGISVAEFIELDRCLSTRFKSREDIDTWLKTPADCLMKLSPIEFMKKEPFGTYQVINHIKADGV